MRSDYLNVNNTVKFVIVSLKKKGINQEEIPTKSLNLLKSYIEQEIGVWSKWEKLVQKRIAFFL